MKILDQYPDVSREIRDAFRWPTRICIIALVALILIATWVTQGCSTRTLYVSPDGAVNATHTAVGYCPEAVLIRIDNGTVEMLAEASGVGATVQALGSNAVEVIKP